MPGAEWQPGLPSRCGQCLSEDIEYQEDGSARCRTCGTVTPTYRVRMESARIASARRPTEMAAASQTARDRPPLAPPPATGPDLLTLGRLPLVKRARQIMLGATLAFLVATFLPLTGSGPGLALGLLLVGIVGQLLFALIAFTESRGFARPRIELVTQAFVVGIIEVVFSVALYGGVAGIVGGASTLFAAFLVRFQLVPKVEEAPAQA